MILVFLLSISVLTRVFVGLLRPAKLSPVPELPIAKTKFNKSIPLSITRGQVMFSHEGDYLPSFGFEMSSKVASQV